MPGIRRPRPARSAQAQPYHGESGPLRLTITPRKVVSRFAASPLIIIYVFAGFIIVGTLLLLMPFANRGGEPAPPMVALFTATSAVTVTGLAIQDTAAYWTRTGQVFILGMMFVGGLGFMSIATLVLIRFGQRVPLAQRLLIRESLGVEQLGGLFWLTARMVVVAVAIQLLGFLALLARFWPLYTPAEAVWQAAFHTVSAFNNCGFVAFTEPGGLAAFREDIAVLGILAALTLLGGLSYWVIVDMIKARRWTRLTLNSKLVLVMSAALVLIGFVVFLATEYHNPRTIGPLAVHVKILNSAFQSVISRTSGLNTVDFSATNPQTNFFFTGLMVIGGASASVAGGIKVNTVALILIGILSTLRGKTYISAFGKEIPQEQVQRAMTIGAISTLFVFVMALMLTFTDSDLNFINLLFEAVSAFATVGMSAGIAPELSTLGQLILMFGMFIGRLGTFTVALALAQHTEVKAYRYVQERVTIG